MSDSSPLIVPLELDALVVNDGVRAQEFARWKMSYETMPAFASVEPAPFSGIDTNFTAESETIVSGGATASQYYNGVYLKWRLPDALRQGHQDHASAKVSFPQVPNRWLVVRDGALAWLVESDFCRPPGPQPASVADTGSEFLDAAGNPSAIGRAIALTRDGWKEPEPDQRGYLTAVAPGNLAFASYQPASNNVFSFVDQPLASERGPNDYLVLGWHIEPPGRPAARRRPRGLRRHHGQPRLGAAVRHRSPGECVERRLLRQYPRRGRLDAAADGRRPGAQPRRGRDRRQHAAGTRDARRPAGA